MSLLILSPLFLSGNRPFPQLLLILLGLGLCISLVFMRDGLKLCKNLAIACLILLFLIQLIPIPFKLWSEIPGHEVYAAILQHISEDVMHELRPLSLIPPLTTLSFAMMLTFLGVLSAISLQPTERLRYWVYIALSVAFFESILGLWQYGVGPQSLLRMGPGFGTPSAVGTYANRDHLAGLLEMMLPLSIALLLASFKRGRDQSVWQVFKNQLASFRWNHTYLFLSLSIVIMLAILFTQSRAGVFLMFLGIFLMTLLMTSRFGFKKILNISGVALLIALIAAIQVGIIPLLNRFLLEDPLKDMRWPVARQTWLGIQYFFPFGSGLGTFPDVFERFQTKDLNGVFVNHAHNDFLEFIFEGGVLACLVVTFFMFYYTRQWGRIWPKEEWRSYHYIQIGAGVSILLMLLHSLVDFNLHISSNLIYFAFVLGLFFHSSRSRNA